MSIEGNRSEGGMFSPGEILSASKLNDLAQHAGYGRQWHSSGNLVAQGPFGTVDLSGGNVAAGSGIGYDQFEVTWSKTKKDDKETYWFKIRPGYCTVLDHFIRIVGTPAGAISVGDTSISTNEFGVRNLYYVNTCNAFGSKKDLDVGNGLNENIFSVESTATNEDSFIIFLYRHTPGFNKPKLGVMSYLKFVTYFTAWTSGFQAATVQPNYGSAAGTRTNNLKGGLHNYMETNLPPLESPIRLDQMKSAETDFMSVTNVKEWYRLGLHVQVIAIFDPATEDLRQVKKGHVTMETSAEEVIVSVTDPINTTTILESNGWGSYFYENPDANFTGLKFES